MVLGDYGTADFREYRTSLQYIYKCKKNKAQDAERRKQFKKGKRNKADQDMIQKRISRRERRDAVQGRTVLWIQRSVLLKEKTVEDYPGRSGYMAEV